MKECLGVKSINRVGKTKASQCFVYECASHRSLPQGRHQQTPYHFRNFLVSDALRRRHCPQLAHHVVHVFFRGSLLCCNRLLDGCRKRQSSSKRTTSFVVGGDGILCFSAGYFGRAASDRLPSGSLCGWQCCTDDRSRCCRNSALGGRL